VPGRLKGSPVYAFKSELEIWLRKNRTQCEGDEPSAEKVPVAEAASATSATKAQTQKKRWYRFLLGAGAAAAIVVLVIVARNQSNKTAEAPTPALTAVPLTTEVGFEGYPSFSPDGNQVAYSWDGEKEDNDDIYIRRVAGGLPVRLTSDPAFDTSPAWAPDGQSIAFLRRLKQERTQLELLLTSPVPGGREQKLAELRIPASQVLAPRVAWTPDSQYLIFPDAAGRDDSTALYLLRLATGETKRLTTPPAKMYGDSSPAISPDGRLLAFVRYAGGDQTQLWLCPLSKTYEPIGMLRRVALEHQWHRDPSWAADGRNLVYVAYTLDMSKRLWRVNATGSNPPTPLPLVGPPGDLPAISAAANCLVYRFSTFDYDIWRIEVPPGGETGTPRRLINSTQPDVTPVYSPDGKRILFGSNRSGAGEIWLSNPDGSNPVQLTFFKAHAARPEWFTDGRRIIFTSNKDGQFDLYILDVEKGSLRRLTDNPARDVAPSISHDGRWVYFASTRSGRMQIWRMPADGGEAMQLTQGGGYSPKEHPKGRFVFYQRTEGTSDVWKVPMEGGEETRVCGPVQGNNFGVAPDGVYFVGPSADGKLVLQFFAFRTQNIRKLAVLGNTSCAGVAVAPDGRSVLYSQRDNAGSDLMLVENFH
jgi:Tol biopolymer transport system component